MKYKFKELIKIGDTVLLDCDEHNKIIVAERSLNDLTPKDVKRLSIIKEVEYDDRDKLYYDVNSALVDVAPTTWCANKHVKIKELTNALIGCPCRSVANKFLHDVGKEVTGFDSTIHEIVVEEILEAADNADVNNSEEEL